jgi:hypothetical protein
MTMVNDRNALLDAAPYRLGNPPGSGILLGSSTPAFKVATDGSITPATITFTATRVGGLVGTLSFASTGGTVTTNGDVATLTSAGMPGAAFSVTASITANGQTFTSNVCVVTKVSDGAQGPQGGQGVPGMDGAQSLVKPIWHSDWTGGAVVSVTDGKVGTQVRRSTSAGTTVETVVSAGPFTAVDRTRYYRTRFWARASSDANGVLYHCLRQFTSASGTAYGPLNSGRDPYLPANVPAHTDWREYSYLWDSTKWQAGVTHVRPDFLLNYRDDTVARTGYWEIQDYSFADVTEAYNAQVSANAAIARSDAMSADGILSRAEKIDLVTEWSNIDAEWAQLRAQANNLGVAYGVYDLRHQDVSDYLLSLSPAWNDTTQDTAINRADYRLKFNNYYKEKQAQIGANNAKAAIASASITLVGRNVQVQGNSLKKTAGAQAWDADAYSRESAPYAYASATITDLTSQCFFGLNNDPVDYVGWEGIFVSFYIEGSGTVYTGLNETLTNTFTVVVGDVLMVSYDGVNVRWHKNGSLLRTLAVDIGGVPLYFDSSFANVGATLGSCKFGPIPSALWAHQGGTGKPADNATVGAPPGTNVGNTPAEIIESKANGAVKAAPGFVLNFSCPSTVSGAANTTLTAGANISPTGHTGTARATWTVVKVSTGPSSQNPVVNGASGNAITVKVTGSTTVVSVEVSVSVTDDAGLTRVANGYIDFNFGTA